MSGKKGLFWVTALKAISVYNGWRGMAGFMVVGALERESSQGSRQRNSTGRPQISITSYWPDLIPLATPYLLKTPHSSKQCYQGKTQCSNHVPKGASSHNNWLKELKYSIRSWLYYSIYSFVCHPGCQLDLIYWKPQSLMTKEVS